MQYGKLFAALGIVVYILMAIFTFGHAVNNTPYCDYKDCRVGAGILSGLAWPLYWSIKLQEKD